ncbi:MAG: hypothetical protein RIC55_32430 [Pirellulaceae bacterium]
MKLLNRHRVRRRGLAPLEFVLWLPVLLSVTALMVVFGVMGAWRVRGEIVSRDAIWRTRWPRTGASEPRPDVRTWPADAEMGVGSAPAFMMLDHPEIDLPVIRGPLPNGFEVKETLEPTRGAREGRSSIVQEYPLLPDLGPYRSGRIRHPLLDGQWRIAEMGAPNVVRRTLILYELPVTEQSLPDAFRDEVVKVVSMSNYSALNVLDRDEEIRKYRGGYVDFHPGVPSMCTLDAEQVYRQGVQPLIDTRDDDGEIQLGRISRLPRTMTQYFLNMYRARVNALKQQIEQMQQEQMSIPNQLSELASQAAGLQSQISAAAGGQSSDLQSQLAGVQSEQAALQSRLDSIPDLISSAQSEIATLEPKISQLEAYEERLDEIEEQLENQADAVIP